MVDVENIVNAYKSIWVLDTGKDINSKKFSAKLEGATARDEVDESKELLGKNQKKAYATLRSLGLEVYDELQNASLDWSSLAGYSHVKVMNLI